MQGRQGNRAAKEAGHEAGQGRAKYRKMSLPGQEFALVVFSALAWGK